MKDQLTIVLASLQTEGRSGVLTGMKALEEIGRTLGFEMTQVITHQNEDNFNTKLKWIPIHAPKQEEPPPVPDDGS